MGMQKYAFMPKIAKKHALFCEIYLDEKKQP